MEDKEQSIMLLALEVFCFYLFLSAVTMTTFWALVVRYSSIEDLDPKNLFVRWFRK